MPHAFNDWFPMSDHPAEGVTGAHTWLCRREYHAASQAIRAFRRNPTPVLNRRLLIVGLIYDNSLISDFLTTCWTQGNRNLLGRLQRMDQLHSLFRRRPFLVNQLTQIPH